MLATSSHQGCRCKVRGAARCRLLLQLGAGKASQHDAAVLLHVLHAGKASQRCVQQVAPLTAQRADSFPKTKSRHVVLVERVPAVCHNIFAWLLLGDQEEKGMVPCLLCSPGGCSLYVYLLGRHKLELFRRMLQTSDFGSDSAVSPSEVVPLGSSLSTRLS